MIMQLIIYDHRNVTRLLWQE